MTPAWFNSPDWASLTRALLHTIWQATLIAVLLGLILRRMTHAVARYRFSVAALAGVVVAGVISWAIISCPPPVKNGKEQSSSTAVSTAAPDNKISVITTMDVASNPPDSVNTNWTAWLALFWLMGAAAMLVRAGIQVTGAARLRRSSRPLADERIEAILNEARKLMGLTRQVRIAATEQMTSPAVVGVIVPTLIFPLSLVTTLTAEQIRFVLLHELAHIRRGDYLAHLFQLFAEALLFFNPAVWWISRQMRIEREACCDAMAIELSGAPAEYARTLLCVAESVIHPPPAAAAAFGADLPPSSLTERVKRLLVPGYRPLLRLTWRAMLLALLTGTGLLFLSAIGTRMTVAAILTPEERIKRIETKMAEYGAEPVVQNFNDDARAAKILVSGTVRMADGSPVPKWAYLNACSSVRNSSYVTSVLVRNGAFKDSIRAGTIYLGLEVSNYAPAFIGPLDGFHTNRFENLQLVLDQGFDATLKLVDAESKKPLAGAKVATMAWLRNSGFQSQFLKTGPDGTVTLRHCVNLPFTATIDAPGHEMIQKRFSGARAGQEFQVELAPGAVVSGTVLDKETSQPVGGAEFHLLYQSEFGARFAWDDPLHLLGKTDSAGRFSLDQLRSGLRYYIGVSAAGHESVILSNIVADARDLVVKLGPQLIVRGRVIGKIDGLQRNDDVPAFYLSTQEVYDQNSYGDAQWVPVRTVNGVAMFQFTNRVTGTVTLSGGGYSEERDISAPVNDWVVNLSKSTVAATKPRPTREVIFHFKTPSGATPAGTVTVSVPDNLEPAHLTAHEVELGITNGEARAQIAIGGTTTIEPDHMIGYWFDRSADNGRFFMITVTNGPGPMIIEIPVLPAGAIYASARNADGSPAGGLLFGVSQLKRAPGESESAVFGQSDGFTDEAPRKWSSGPLPLGGTYQVHCWRGNTFARSKAVRLTESNPDAEVELRLPPGKTIGGLLLDLDGKPLANSEVKTSFEMTDGGGFGLKSILTDEHGQFQLEDATPDAGNYFVEIDQPGLMAVRVKMNSGARAQVIRLKRGRKLAGRVVEAGTGYAIPNTEVRIFDESLKFPTIVTHTDASGHFEFTSLGNVKYKFFIDAGQMISNDDFSADGRTNLILAIKLYAWSKAKPVLPAPN